MTLPRRSLHPTSGNDRGTLLGVLEFVTCCGLQFAEVVGTVVDHDVAFKSSPKVFDRIHVGRVGRYVTLQSVQVLAYKPTTMRPQSIPDLPTGVASNGS